MDFVQDAYAYSTFDKLKKRLKEWFKEDRELSKILRNHSDANAFACARLQF